jgi:AraC family transcriptional regulator
MQASSFATQTAVQSRGNTPARDEREIEAAVCSYAPGRITLSASPYTLVCMHIGQSVDVRCLRNETVRQGREVQGDLQIIPPHTPSTWEINKSGVWMIVRLSPALLRRAISRLSLQADSIAIADRFQVRDPVLEHIVWALKADIDADQAGRRLIQDSLGLALAMRLIQRHNSRSLPMRGVRGRLSAATLKQVISYIEDNLPNKMSTAEISRLVGISSSHLQMLFRNSTGLSLYQYALRRRVELAQSLLKNRELSVEEVATATGFAHQSHLARHMRKIFGCSPTMVRADIRSPVVLAASGAACHKLERKS